MPGFRGGESNDWFALQAVTNVIFRVENYIDSGWPDDVSGVPRTIAEFGGEMGDDRDQVFNWGTQCTV